MDEKQTDSVAQSSREGNSNAVTHGAYRYVVTGALPSDMQGFDKQKAAEFLALCGGQEKFRAATDLAATAQTVVTLIIRNMEANHDPTGKELPAGLRMLGTYMEILRRNLETCGLTPASAGKIKLDDDPLTHAKAIEAMKRDKE